MNKKEAIAKNKELEKKQYALFERINIHMHKINLHTMQIPKAKGSNLLKDIYEIRMKNKELIAKHKNLLKGKGSTMLSVKTARYSCRLSMLMSKKMALRQFLKD
ncbi:MAG: hypothetical protein HZC28_19530 [Spirochaetes bacterium]|nr:hypothetical protein [Spirochaetota bacterium]